MVTGFNTQVSNGEYRLQFETDNKEYYLLMQETARRCVDGEPVTNAYRIRNMSDEELGRFLAAVENRRSAAGGGAFWDGAAHAIEWLKQPAEER